MTGHVPIKIKLAAIVVASIPFRLFFIYVSLQETLMFFIATMAMVLATKKISHTATAFELKFMSFDKLNPHLIGN